MGIHAYSERAFLLPLKEFFGLLDQCHVLGIQRDAVRLIRALVDNDRDLDLERIIGQLQSANTVEEVVICLEGFVRSVRGKVGTRGLRSCQLLQVVFKAISHVVLPIQPEFVGVVEGQDVDMGDDDLPTNTPLLWFDFDKCFVLRMTASGQQLARTLRKKRIYPDEWTTML